MNFTFLYITDSPPPPPTSPRGNASLNWSPTQGCLPSTKVVSYWDDMFLVVPVCCFFVLMFYWGNGFQLVCLNNFFDRPQTRLKRLKKHLRDCSLNEDYTQGLVQFTRKQVQKCAIEKCQLYQTKPVAVELVDHKRTQTKREFPAQ